MYSSVCSISFGDRCVAEDSFLKPESGCSGPCSPSTALSAINEPDMKQDTIKNLPPASVAPAAPDIALAGPRNNRKNPIGVRLF